VTDGGDQPPSTDGDKERKPPVLGRRARLETMQRGIMRHAVVLGAMDMLRAYDRAGGGMLAGGLSYFGFFTVVPALLLFASLLGVVIEDAALRAELIDDLVDQIDPIRDVAKAIIDGLAGTGRAGTIIGVIGLLWGASGFYGALQASMQRMFPGPGSRDFFRTRLNGVLTVVLILGSMLAAVLFIFVAPLVLEWVSQQCVEVTELDARLSGQLCAFDLDGISEALGPVAAMGVAFVAAFLVYVALPPDGPTAKQAFVPAVIAGITIGLLTSLFGWIAPLLVRHWLALGVVGSVFVALIWFNLVFQVLLYGAALARLRRDRDRTRSGPPTF
jgi:membrane protein